MDQGSCGSLLQRGPGGCGGSPRDVLMWVRNVARNGYVPRVSERSGSRNSVDAVSLVDDLFFHIKQVLAEVRHDGCAGLLGGARCARRRPGWARRTRNSWMPCSMSCIRKGRRSLASWDTSRSFWASGCTRTKEGCDSRRRSSGSSWETYSQAAGGLDVADSDSKDRLQGAGQAGQLLGVCDVHLGVQRAVHGFHQRPNRTAGTPRRKQWEGCRKQQLSSCPPGDHGVGGSTVVEAGGEHALR